MLKNYTTLIATAQSLAEISRMLVVHRARSITIVYDDDGIASGLEFALGEKNAMRWFRLPANWRAVQEIFTREWKAGRRVPDRSQIQAQRTAWRIVRDWLAAQLAIEETGMVTLDEVMLPYMLMDNDRTLYQLYQDSPRALPGPKAASA